MTIFIMAGTLLTTGCGRKIKSDLFTKYLDKKGNNAWVDRALTDSTYRNYCERNKIKKYSEKDNSELATYGDAVIKLCYSEIFLDNVENITEEKKKYESDNYLVNVVARHYDLLDEMYYDKEHEFRPYSYDYENYYSNNDKNSDKNYCKYIATAVEAMIGAIYKETNDLEKITDLLISWKDGFK